MHHENIDISPAQWVIRLNPGTEQRTEIYSSQNQNIAIQQLQLLLLLSCVVQQETNYATSNVAL